MINLTMGYWEGVGKFKSVFQNKAGLVAVLLLILGGFLGVKFWNYRTATSAVTEAAVTPEQVFTRVSVDHQWVLLGNEFTFREKSLPFRAEVSPDFADAVLTYAVEGTDLTGRMLEDETGRYWAEIFVGN